jgi:hypothetical protein
MEGGGSTHRMLFIGRRWAKGILGSTGGLEKGVDCMGVKSDWLERPRAYMARKGMGGKYSQRKEGWI